MNTKYTKELVGKIVENSSSYKQVILGLGLKVTGGNYAYIKKVINYHEIPVSHFLGSGHHSGNRGGGIRLEKGSYLRVYDRQKVAATDNIRKYLLRDGIKEHRCEICGNTEWNGHPMPLTLHHIDGDRWNNVLENLQILCYNCHAQTDNFCGKNIRTGKIAATPNKVIKRKKLCACGKEIKISSTMCKSCVGKERTALKKLYKCNGCGKELSGASETGLCVNCCNITRRKVVARPSQEQLEYDVRALGFEGTGRKYGVSGNAIRDWLGLRK